MGAAYSIPIPIALRSNDTSNLVSKHTLTFLFSCKCLAFLNHFRETEAHIIFASRGSSARHMQIFKYNNKRSSMNTFSKESLIWAMRKPNLVICKQ